MPLDIKAGEINTDEYTKAQQAAGVQTQSLTAKTIALNMAMNLGTMLVITAVMKGLYYIYDNVINKSEKLAEAFSTIKDEMSSLNSEIESHSDMIDIYLEDYEDYSAHIDLSTNTNIDLDAEQYAEFIEAQRDIATR